MQLWWLSFCDGKRPVGSQFLGACVVSGCCMVDAVQTAHLNGVNPGGEVMGHPIEPLFASRVQSKWVGVLLSREDCAAMDKELHGG
jgi:hypothetical protein